MPAGPATRQPGSPPRRLWYRAGVANGWAASMRMARLQVGLAGSPALCAGPASPDPLPGYSQKRWWIRASVETLPTPLRRSWDGRRGCQEGEGRTGSRTPPPPKCGVCSTLGLALPAPLRRSCGHCASLGPAWKRRELRFARLAGRRDAGAGDRSVPPTRTARLRRPSFTHAHPLPRPAPGHRRSAEARAGDLGELAKESGGGGRGWTCRPCVRVGGFGRPCKASRQPGAPTSIHFCASEKAGSGGGSGCRG